MGGQLQAHVRIIHTAARLSLQVILYCNCSETLPLDSLVSHIGTLTASNSLGIQRHRCVLFVCTAPVVISAMQTLSYVNGSPFSASGS